MAPYPVYCADHVPDRLRRLKVDSALDHLVRREPQMTMLEKLIPGLQHIVRDLRVSRKNLPKGLAPRAQSFDLQVGFEMTVSLVAEVHYDGRLDGQTFEFRTSSRYLDSSLVVPWQFEVTKARLRH